MAKKHILIICGEPSGDLNAADLVKSILQINPELRISAVGGKLLRSSGAEVFSDIKELSVIGLFDVLRKLPKFLALKKRVLEKIREDKPDAIILVDFSGFNLRIAKEIKKTIPTLYYTSPQVWASRSGRIQTIKECVHKMVVLFKFEEEFYRKFGIDADFVGHPLLDIVLAQADKLELLKGFNLYDSWPIIALMPGSRQQEIRHNLPVMLKAAVLIHKNISTAQFIIIKSAQVEWATYHPITHAFGLDLKVIEGKTYDCLKVADFALVASGTATLETAIMQKPFVVIYKMSLLNYLLYRPQVKIPFIGMVNIVSGKKVVPEFIQFGACPKKISGQVINLLRDISGIEKMKLELGGVKAQLGDKGASVRAAKIVLNFLEKPPATA